MTTTTTHTSTDAPSRTPIAAALALATSAVLSAVGSFWDATGNDSGNDGWGAYLLTVAIAAVVTLVVFGLVVRGSRDGNAGRRGLVLGILSVLAVPVFWTGVMPVLAIGAIACALDQRDVSGSFSASGKAALGLSVLSLLAAGVLALIG